MTTSQPDFVCVAQLGDVSPMLHDGYWVFVDKTGVYRPEAEYFCSDTRTYCRFVLEPCTYTNGILSDNPYHPNHPAWFGDRLQKVADYVGKEVEGLIQQLCSTNPIERAMGYRDLASYHGYFEFDEYPTTLIRHEMKKRYTSPMYTNIVPEAIT